MNIMRSMPLFFLAAISCYEQPSDLDEEPTRSVRMVQVEPTLEPRLFGEQDAAQANLTHWESIRLRMLMEAEAEIHLADGDPESALKVLRALVNQVPRSWQAFKALALAEARYGTEQAAIAAMDRGTSFGPITQFRLDLSPNSLLLRSYVRIVALTDGISPVTPSLLEDIERLRGKKDSSACAVAAISGLEYVAMEKEAAELAAKSYLRFPNHFGVLSWHLEFLKREARFEELWKTVDEFLKAGGRPQGVFRYKLLEAMMLGDMGKVLERMEELFVDFPQDGISIYVMDVGQRHQDSQDGEYELGLILELSQTVNDISSERLWSLIRDLSALEGLKSEEKLALAAFCVSQVLFSVSNTSYFDSHSGEAREAFRMAKMACHLLESQDLGRGWKCRLAYALMAASSRLDGVDGVPEINQLLKYLDGAMARVSILRYVMVEEGCGEILLEIDRAYAARAIQGLSEEALSEGWLVESYDYLGNVQHDQCYIEGELTNLEDLRRRCRLAEPTLMNHARVDWGKRASDDDNPQTFVAGISEVFAASDRGMIEDAKKLLKGLVGVSWTW